MKKFLLNQPAIVDILKKDNIVVIDGGARGDLFAPFNKVNKNIIKVIRFDPDPDASFNNVSPQDIVFHKALWNSSGKININIAKDPRASSALPFNRELQKHIDPYYTERNVDKTVEVETISLDELLLQQKDLKIDFIKLDIHGAEYEVLKGATHTLKNTIGLLIESWVIPIHKGQKLRAHVEVLAYDHQFYAFEENYQSKWIRNKSKFTKEQPIAIDTLSFKDPILDNNITDSISAIKLIGVANLFDHNGYALQLNTYFYTQGILDRKTHDLISNFINTHSTKSMRDIISLKLSKVFGRIADCSFK